jgi:hypothetical protein
MTSLYTAWVLRFHLKVSFAIRVKAGDSAQHIDPYSGTGRPPSATPLGSGSLQSYWVLRWPWGIGLFRRLSFWSFVLKRMSVSSSLASKESAISACSFTVTTAMSEDVRGCGQSHFRAGPLEFSVSSQHLSSGYAAMIFPQRSRA